MLKEGVIIMFSSARILIKPCVKLLVHLSPFRPFFNQNGLYYKCHIGFICI